MKDAIIKQLDKIEHEHNIKILYACESGSRAWGFPSQDSDYDVRFLYVHPLEWYLTINSGKDTLDFPIDGELDFGGWELRKTCSLVMKSNAIVWEWLQSPIIYQESLNFKSRFYQVIKSFYSPKAACYHYLSIAKNTMEQHFQSTTIKMKKYFYILRPILAAKWICDKKTIPPMELHPLLTLIEDRNDILENIDELLIKKEQATESDTITRMPLLDDFIQQEFQQCDQQAVSLPVAEDKHSESLNVFFRGEVLK